MDNLSKADRKEIERKRAQLEAAMEGEIDSLVATRRNARKALNDDPMPMKTAGYGRRTLSTRSTMRGSTVWARRAKVKQGVFD